MDTTQWSQGIGLVKPVKEFASSTTTTSGSDTCTTTRTQVTERRPRPHKEQALNCPRRYWTEGGSLRNVPVGGGSRKNKRSSMSSATAISSSSCNSFTEALATASAPKKFHADLIPPSILLSTNSETPKLHEKQDLNLAFRQHSIPEYNDYFNLEISNANNISSSNSNYCAAVRALSDMEVLTNGMTAKGIGSLMPLPMTEYPTGLGLHGFRPPTLSFPLDGISGGGGGGIGGGGYGDLPGIQESVTGKLLFPLEVLKPAIPSNNVADQFEVQGDDPPRYWNGVIGGGSW
ncbi:dof zinc finger protein 1-like isoform X4 [Musa acuminata AAA Group]|uniref:Dof-type domain-containing protein n=1 Tax=Musa acuminata subsp. malaccensis TaxID=214687 RepID=A0A804IRP2_MUSAM|nr:PREDICTED: dof zinc finger protein DOF4.6-like isoform X2 [Musa acuminata subsp. malaccensis]